MVQVANYIVMAAAAERATDACSFAAELVFASFTALLSFLAPGFTTGGFTGAVEGALRLHRRFGSLVVRARDTDINRTLDSVSTVVADKG